MSSEPVAADGPTLDAAVLTSAARMASHALHGRAPAPLAERGGERSLAARALRIYHSPLYRWPYTALMIGLSLLALAESPNPLASLRSATVRDAVHAADALVLIAAAADVALQAAFLSPRVALRRGWTLTKLVVVVALAANLAAHSVLGAAAPYALRALRPLLLIERLRNVRKLFASVFQTAPRIVNIGVLLVLNLLLHAVLGFALFAGMDGVNCDVRRPASRDVPRCSTMLYPPQSCSSFFGSLGETALHLFELMTAVNFPAVAIPVMRCRAWSPLFFLSFVITAVYLLFNLALAVAYNEFSVGMRGEVLTRYARVFIGLDASFLRLSDASRTRPPAPAAPPAPALLAGPASLPDGDASAAEQGPPAAAATAAPRVPAFAHALAALGAAAPPLAGTISAWGPRGTTSAAQSSTAARMAAASRAEAEAAVRARERASARLGGAAFRQFFVALRSDLPSELADPLAALLFAVFARRGEAADRSAEPALDVHAFRRLMVSCADLRAKRDAVPADVGDLLEAGEEDVLYVGPAPPSLPLPEASAGGAAAPRAAAVAINPLALMHEAEAAQQAAAMSSTQAAPAAPPTLSDLMDARRQRVARATAIPVGQPQLRPSTSTVVAGPSAPEAALVPLSSPVVLAAPASPASLPAPSHSSFSSVWGGFAARWLLPLAAHPGANLLFDVTTVLAAAAVLTQLTVDTDDAPTGTADLIASLKNLQTFTLVYGVAFVSLRVVAWGPLRFWRRGALNRFDLAVVGALTGGTVLIAASALPPSAALFVLFLRFLRLARVFRHVPGFNSTIAALFSILPVLGQLLLILVAALYAFAIVGMELFAGRLVASNAAVAASSYGYYNYYAVINFDSLEGSLWALFYLLSVNDWVVLMEGCVAATGLWARAYFIAFWATIVLFLLNVFIAFVTVAFGAEKTRRDEGDRSSASRGAQREAALRIGTKRGAAGGGGTAGGGSDAAAGARGAAEDDEEEEVEGDVVKAVAGAASALSSGAVELLELLASGGGTRGGGGLAAGAGARSVPAATAAAPRTSAAAASRHPFFFGDWRATLAAASGVDLRGWLLTRRPRLADVYDALYKDDLVATFRETFAEEE